MSIDNDNQLCMLSLSFISGRHGRPGPDITWSVKSVGRGSGDGEGCGHEEEGYGATAESEHCRDE